MYISDIRLLGLPLVDYRLSIGGVAAGTFSAGGAAIGIWAVGAVAIASSTAIGGLAIAGSFAKGGAAVAEHVNDTAAAEHFASNAFFRVTEWIFARRALLLVPLFLVWLLRVWSRRGRGARWDPSTDDRRLD